MGPWLLPVHWSFIWSSATKFTLGYVWWCGAFGSANVSRDGTSFRGADRLLASAAPSSSRRLCLLNCFAVQIVATSTKYISLSQPADRLSSGIVGFFLRGSGIVDWYVSMGEHDPCC